MKIEAANALHDEQKKAEMLRVKPMMEELREYADALEILVDDDIWPVPKFWEMLFISEIDALGRKRSGRQFPLFAH